VKMGLMGGRIETIRGGQSRNLTEFSPNFIL
jgi:hypothetical protein